MSDNSRTDLVFITNTRGSVEDFGGVYSRSFPNWQGAGFIPPDVHDWKGVHLTTPNGERINGRFVVIGSDAFDIVDGVSGFRKAVDQTRQAIEYAQTLGAKVICFGAGTKKLVSPKKLHELNHSQVIFSNGDTITVGMAILQLESLTVQADLNLRSPETTVLVVGAYGVIGTQLARFLSSYDCRLILVGPRMEMLQKLVDQELNSKRVELYTGLAQVPSQRIHVVLTATNHPDSLISPSQLRDWGEYSLAIDIAEPPNIKPDTVQAMRGRLLRVDGALVDSVGFVSDDCPLIGLQEHQAFACLAEGLVVAHMVNRGILFGETQLMEVDSGIIPSLMDEAAIAGFHLSSPTNFGIPVSERDFRIWRDQWREGNPHLYAAQAQA